jgi:uncharacterized membrane protein YeaQ/YmgE (transglycosylase-associated protein family)
LLFPSAESRGVILPAGIRIDRVLLLSILSWVAAGLAVGLLIGLIRQGEDLLENAILAVVGAIIGGWAYSALTEATVTQFSVAGTAAALAVSVVFLAAARVVTRGRSMI